MVRRPAPLLAGLLALALAACTAAPAQEAARAGPRLVSLNPCTDAILAEVADPRQVLALSHYSADPASSSLGPGQAAQFRFVGDSVEEVAALRPDVVVGSAFVPPAARAAYARLGLRLETFNIATSIEESRAQVRQLAALAGHPERGEALVRRIDAALAAAAPPRGSAAVPALVWMSGGMVPGEDTLIVDLLQRTGFVHAGRERGLAQADLLPLEQVLANPPRVILTAGNLHGNEDRLLRHPALASLDQTTRAPFDSSLLWCGGPVIPRAAARLAQVRAAP